MQEVNDFLKIEPPIGNKHGAIAHPYLSIFAPHFAYDLLSKIPSIDYHCMFFQHTSFEFTAGAQSDNFALIHNAYPVAEEIRFVHIVGGEQYGLLAL
ncbi:hypothetical protein ES703_114555 [subsurface metagenome]